MSTPKVNKKSNSTQSIPSIELDISGGTYIVNGFFKDKGKTVAEKFFGIMEKEVENPVKTRYNNDIPQESLAVGKTRRT